MVQIIILQAQRKIKEAQRKIQIYHEINREGHLDMMIRVEESTIKQMQSMIQELEAEMKKVEVAHIV